MVNVGVCEILHFNEALVMGKVFQIKKGIKIRLKWGVHNDSTWK